MKRIFAVMTFAMLIANATFAQRIGVVLGGGGALGYAHLGVLQALEEAGIRPTVVAGTSMGALIGVLYADGKTPAEIMQIAQEERLYRNCKFLKMNFSAAPGIYNLDVIGRILKQHVPSNSFDSLKHTFYACVSNIEAAVPEYIGTGNQLDEYVIASASIPTIFEAKTINGVQYIDGGMLNNFPAQAIADQCDFLIGIDVLPLTHKKAARSIEALFYGLRAVQHANSLPGHALCDLLIEVHAIDSYTEFEFKHYKEIYQIGYETAKKELKNFDFKQLKSKNRRKISGNSKK